MNSNVNSPLNIPVRPVWRADYRRQYGYGGHLRDGNRPAQFDILTAVHKHYSPEEWNAFVASASADVVKHVMVSTGTSDADFEKTKQILNANPALNFVCIDVANGYSEHFVQFVSKAREARPTKTIIAGNVVTGEMCEELILSGADIVKVGIGGLRMHHARQNRRWVSAAVRRYRMCRCGAWPGRPDHQ